MLAKENAKHPNQRDAAVISSKEATVKQAFKSSIETFLTSDAKKTVFELSDITNNASSFGVVAFL